MLYVAVALRSFRRYSTYTAATLAGIFTNCVFGVIISLHLHRACGSRTRPPAGTTSPTRSPTAWLGQAMIMTVAVWGGGATDDLAERIRTGDVAIDLYRPVSLLGWCLAERPRPRGVPPAHPRGRPDGRRRAAVRPALPRRAR